MVVVDGMQEFIAFGAGGDRLCYALGACSFFLRLSAKPVSRYFVTQPAMSTVPFSRRVFLQTTLLGASGAALVPAAEAQGLTGPAYVVSNWSGPVSAFSLPDTSGRIWQSPDLRGRAVLLNFWASWCEPCRAEMPTLQQVADLYGPDKLLVLAINFKEPAARAIQFAKSTGVTLPVLLDSDGRTARQWGVKVFPTTLTLDSQGRPRQRVQGEVDWTSNAAEQLIAGLMKP